MEAKIQFSATDISITMLTEGDFHSLSDFYCGVNEIDKFFHKEVALCSKYKYLSAYKCVLISTGEIVGLFTLANDVLNLDYEDIVDFPNLGIEYQDIFISQSSYPAINIGHLAIKKEYQSRGLGAIIVDIVQMTFSQYVMSGCQFITVDAINNGRTLRFYQDICGFEFQTLRDVASPTRRMYLDIFTNRLVGLEG